LIAAARSQVFCEPISSRFYAAPTNVKGHLISIDVGSEVGNQLLQFRGHYRTDCLASLRVEMRFVENLVGHRRRNCCRRGRKPARRSRRLWLAPMCRCFPHRSRSAGFRFAADTAVGFNDGAAGSVVTSASNADLFTKHEAIKLIRASAAFSQVFCITLGADRAIRAVRTAKHPNCRDAKPKIIRARTKRKSARRAPRLL
jgi:hypothetical protein